MRKYTIILLILVMCGGSETAATVEETTTTLSEETTTTLSEETTDTLSEETTTTTSTTTTLPKINFNYKTIFSEEDSFMEQYSWINEWVPSEVDDSCVSNSYLNQSTVTPAAKRNLEIIFNKDFESIDNDDILNLKILSFFDGYELPGSLSFKNSPTNDIESYDGLEYLTCLQYLDLYDQNLGRDLRFLSNLTNLRYLDLLSTDMPRIEVLYPLNNLETLILPAAFRELDKLVNIPSLKKIAAGYSLTCQEDVFSKMENLEVVLLNGSDIQSQKNLPTREDSFSINKSPSGEHIELIVPGGPNAFMPDFDAYNLSGIHSREYMMNVMENIYDVVDDNYEAVIFVGNQLESSVGYNGQASYISNDEPGLGTPIWSASSCFGSNGKLRGYVSFPSTSALYSVTSDDYGTYGSGPLLHEIMHLWGGADIIPYFQIQNGLYGAGHWGYSSGGVLGGFNPDSLNQIEDNVYQVSWFGTVGNDLTWNMGNAEKYIMGILPSEDFEDIISFVDMIEVDDLCENYIEDWYNDLSTCLKPGKVLTYTLNDITDIYGDRAYIGSRNIDALVVYVSEESVTDAEWSILDEKLNWYTAGKTIDDGFQNIYEASDGLLNLSFPKP
ncbi:MAG: hypothetical protein P8M74_03730 [Candidatus Actinomarina sp.]|nr:hypothetical protein [Candidatus Actinomarina sp.]